MLQTLRENVAVKKIVLWLVVLGMVSGIGIGVTAVYDSLVTGKGTAGLGPWAMRIGSETVSPSMFQDELKVVGRQMGARGQDDSDSRQLILLRAKSGLARRIVELMEARKAGLSVSDQEVSDYLTSIPGLQRNGQFIGAEQYRRTIESNGEDVLSFENRLRDEILVQKWESLVGASAVVTDREVEGEFRRRNEKVRFDYVTVDPTKYPGQGTSTDVELKAFYDTHPDRYQRGETRRARFVTFNERTAATPPAPPTEAEIRAAYDGDRARYPGEFEKERASVLQQLSFQRTQIEVDQRAVEFRATLSDPSALDAAASRAGLRIEDTGLIERGPDALSKLGPEFVEALFRAAPGAVIGPVKMVRGSAIAAIAESRPPHRATLEEARSEIVQDITKDRSRDATLAAARRAVAASSGDLAAVAKTLGSSVKSGAPVGRGEPIQDLGFSPAIEDAAFKTEAGKIADPVTSGGGFVIVLKVIEKKRADPSLIAAEREKIREDLRRNRQYMLVDSVLTTVGGKMKIEENQEFFKQFGS